MNRSNIKYFSSKNLENFKIFTNIDGKTCLNTLDDLKQKIDKIDEKTCLNTFDDLRQKIDKLMKNSV